MSSVIELAGIVVHSKRWDTPWGKIRVQLVVLAEGRKVRMGLPTKLPEDFRKAAAEVARWIIDQRGHTPEAVDDLEAALREALSHATVDISKDQT